MRPSCKSQVRQPGSYHRRIARKPTNMRHRQRTKIHAAFVDTSVVNGLFSGLNHIIQEAPMVSAFITCGLKSSFADALAQKRELTIDATKGGIIQERSAICFRRSFAFLMYGGLYLGMAQHHIYSHMYPSFFGNNPSGRTVAKMVLFDMTFVSTFLTLPIAYLIKALIYKKTMRDGLKSYFQDCKYNGLWFKNCFVWAPVQSLTFTVIPLHLRVSFIALVSFFWLQLFSSICGKD